MPVPPRAHALPQRNAFNNQGRQHTTVLQGLSLRASASVYRSTTVLPPDQGAAQTALNGRASRRSFNASVAFKF